MSLRRPETKTRLLLKNILSMRNEEWSASGVVDGNLNSGGKEAI